MIPEWQVCMLFVLALAGGVSVGWNIGFKAGCALWRTAYFKLKAIYQGRA